MNPNHIPQRHPLKLTAAAALLLASLAMVGCSKNEEASVGTRVDGAIATTEQKAGEIKAEAKEMAKDATQAVENAGEKAGDKVADAVITTAVNAELAKDSSLSALKINVDTAGGRVALKGTAPSATAKERATMLASAVKGVVSVDNQLSVEAAKM